MRKFLLLENIVATASGGKERATSQERPGLAPAGRRGVTQASLSALISMLMMAAMLFAMVVVSAATSCYAGEAAITISSDRQTVISPGEAADAVYISWKGEKRAVLPSGESEPGKPAEKPGN